MAKFNDPEPDPAEIGFGFGHRNHYWQLADPEWLRDAHVNHGLGTKRIAGVVGCDKNAVRSALRRHGIERPLAPDAPPDGRLLSAEWMRARYVDDQMSLAQLADLLGCERSTVRAWLDRHGVARRPAGRCLPAHLEAAVRRRQGS